MVKTFAGNLCDTSIETTIGHNCLSYRKINLLNVCSYLCQCWCCCWFSPLQKLPCAFSEVENTVNYMCPRADPSKLFIMQFAFLGNLGTEGWHLLCFINSSSYSFNRVNKLYVIKLINLGFIILKTRTNTQDIP